MGADDEEPLFGDAVSESEKTPEKSNPIRAQVTRALPEKLDIGSGFDFLGGTATETHAILVGLLYAFTGTFSYGLISVLVRAVSDLSFSPFYLLLVRAVVQVVLFKGIQLCTEKAEDSESFKLYFRAVHNMTLNNLTWDTLV